MVMQAIGDYLPAAIAVALSPIPIVAIVLVLSTSKTRSTGPAFACGWIVGLAIVTTAVVLLVSDADDPDGDTSTVVSILRIVVGATFLVLAWKKWQSRPGPNDAPAVPAWMTTLETVTPARAFALGAALSGANPKNLALTATAGASIAQAGLDGADTAIAAAAFVVIGSLSVVGAVVIHLLAPDRAAAPLATVKQFMLDNNAVIMMIVLLLLGATILGDGLAGLSS